MLASSFEQIIRLGIKAPSIGQIIKLAIKIGIAWFILSWIVKKIKRKIARDTELENFINHIHFEIGCLIDSFLSLFKNKYFYFAIACTGLVVFAVIYFDFQFALSDDPKRYVIGDTWFFRSLDLLHVYIAEFLLVSKRFFLNAVFYLRDLSDNFFGWSELVKLESGMSRQWFVATALRWVATYIFIFYWLFLKGNWKIFASPFFALLIHLAAKYLGVLKPFNAQFGWEGVEWLYNDSYSVFELLNRTVTSVLLFIEPYYYKIIYFIFPSGGGNTFLNDIVALPSFVAFSLPSWIRTVLGYYDMTQIGNFTFFYLLFWGYIVVKLIIRAGVVIWVEYAGGKVATDMEIEEMGFNRVLERARRFHPFAIPKKIRVLTLDMDNLFAICANVVAVGIKSRGFMAHELGHIKNKDSLRNILVFVLAYLVSFRPMIKWAGILWGYSEYAFRGGFWGTLIGTVLVIIILIIPIGIAFSVFSLLFMVVTLITRVILYFDGRVAEMRADNFAIKIGYADDLSEGFDELRPRGESMKDKIKALLDVHPSVKSRWRKAKFCAKIQDSLEKLREKFSPYEIFLRRRYGKAVKERKFHSFIRDNFSFSDWILEDILQKTKELKREEAISPEEDPEKLYQDILLLYGIWTEEAGIDRWSDEMEYAEKTSDYRRAIRLFFREFARWERKEVRRRKRRASYKEGKKLEAFIRENKNFQEDVEARDIAVNFLLLNSNIDFKGFEYLPFPYKDEYLSLSEKERLFLYKELHKRLSAHVENQEREGVYSLSVPFDEEYESFESAVGTLKNFD